LKKRLVTAAVLASLLGGCAAHSVDIEKLSSPSDEIVWQAGQEAVEKHSWDAARQYFRRLIDAFPNSEHQPEARIALADTYMQEGGVANYVLAVAAYREFLTLYPSHPLSPHAQFQAAEAYYRQMNGPDRDQTPTRQALDEYRRLLDIYPESDLVEPARERIEECRQTLARSEYMVGYFYQRTRKAYRASIYRYRGILRDYPDYNELDEVLYRLGESYAAVALYAQARPELGRLLEEFPESKYADDARELMAEMPEVVPAPPPPADAEKKPGSDTPPASDEAPKEGPVLSSPPQV